MPILDMPLEELRVYGGRNPRPEDIDAFWDASVAEMEALGTGFTLEPAELSVPGVELYHLWYTGVGGARIHAKFARPASASGPLPAVCLYHGYCGRSCDFSELLMYVQARFIAAAMDCRGQGGLSEDVSGVRGNTIHGHIIRGLAEMDPKKLLFRQVFLDAAQLARIVMAMPEVDAGRVAAHGASQGGGLTLACAALTPSLNRAAPVYPFLCDYKRVWEMDLALDAYEELRDYFRRFDPLHAHEDETFRMLGYIDNQHLAHRVKASVLMLTGLMDNICPPSTQFAAYNKLECEKRMLLYPDFGHEYLPECGDHVLRFLMEM